MSQSRHVELRQWKTRLSQRTAYPPCQRQRSFVSAQRRHVARHESTSLASLVAGRKPFGGAGGAPLCNALANGVLPGAGALDCWPKKAAASPRAPSAPTTSPTSRARARSATALQSGHSRFSQSQSARRRLRSALPCRSASTENRGAGGGGGGGRCDVMQAVRRSTSGVVSVLIGAMIGKAYSLVLAASSQSGGCPSRFEVRAGPPHRYA